MVESYGNSEDVPIFERFFAGGFGSIRGYEQRGVGPQDATTHDAVGGESMLLSTLEYTIPVLDALKFAMFYDVGNVWLDVDDFGSSGFKSGTGVGVRIRTPIGPISLDYGYPLDTKDDKSNDKGGKFYFNVSRGF